MGLVYLIHFDRPLQHAKHYLGYTGADTVWPRLAKHRNGTGACLLAELNRLGIGYRVVRIWRDADRNFERKLKNRKESHVFCPYCRPELRQHLYRLHHENQGDNMSPEELKFYQSIGPVVPKKNSGLSPVEKAIAARLHGRGLIDKIKKNNRIYWQPLPFSGH